MNKKNINSVDLNLFKVLHAIIETRNVTAAASMLGLSQPAVSHALNRLRAVFGDELFIRTPKGMQPTERCLAVSQRVSENIKELVEVIQPQSDFDPKEATSTVRIAMGDLLTGLLPVIFMPKAASLAPKLDFRILPARGLIKEVAEQSLHGNLDRGEVDLAFFWNYDVPSRFSFKQLGSIDYVCVGSSQNAKFGDTLSKRFYEETPHVSTTSIDAPTTRFDRELKAIGSKRNVKLRVPHYSAAMTVVAHSHMIASIPRILAKTARASFGLKIAEMPIQSPQRDIIMIWHKSRENEALHKWLREFVAISYLEMEAVV